MRGGASRVDDAHDVALLVEERDQVRGLEDVVDVRDPERHHRRPAADEAQAALAVAPIFVRVGRAR